MLVIRGMSWSMARSTVVGGKVRQILPEDVTTTRGATMVTKVEGPILPLPLPFFQLKANS